MRFFDHQDDAQRTTRKLMFAFVLAVAALVLAMHVFMGLGVLLISPSGLRHLMYGNGPISLAYPPYFSSVTIGVTLLLVLGGWWIEISNLSGPKAGWRLVQRMGGRELRPYVSFSEQLLSNIVDEICIASHMKRPQVVVMDRVKGINAFALGWSEDDAIIGITQGALEWLSREELQGLVAHECSHIHEGDIRLNMHLFGMVSGLEMIHNFGENMQGVGFDAGNNSSASAPAFKILGWIISGVGWVGVLAGHILKAAVSRQREYLADARAVQWTRSRDGLGGVLRKVLMQQKELEKTQKSARLTWHPSMQHLLLAGESDGKKAHRLDSHPTLEDRIKRIYGRHMGPLKLEPQHHYQASNSTVRPPPPTVGEFTLL